MNTTRLLTAAAVAALIAGPVSAQTMSNSNQNQPTTSGQGTMSGQGSMSGQGTSMGSSMSGQGTMSSSGSMSGQGMGSQGSMSGQGSMGMGQGGMNMQRCMTGGMAGGAMGASMSGNANAGGAMGSSMSGAASAGGAMGSSMSMGSNGTMSCMNDMGRIVVSNAPIPDSPSTRAMTGGPDSMGGKMTAPRPGPVQKATRRSNRRR